MASSAFQEGHLEDGCHPLGQARPDGEHPTHEVIIGLSPQMGVAIGSNELRREGAPSADGGG